MRSVAVFALLCLSVWPCRSGAEPLLSIDPASPSPFDPADVLAPGPSPRRGAASLGLRAGDNLNALSLGRELLTGPLFFPVDRVSVGLPGTAVRFQSSTSAAPDIFAAGPFPGSNTLAIPGPQLGLVPGFFGDDLDALDLFGGGSLTYFTIDAFSPSNTGLLANDILVSDGSGSFVVFAEGTIDIGLDPLDEIDALVLLDIVNPGRLDPGIDQALFSLSPFSPSTFTFSGTPYLPGVPGFLSPADVLYTNFRGGFSLWLPAQSLGLLDDDNVNALATTPEPSTWLLLGGGVLTLLVAYRRWKPSSDGAFCGSRHRRVEEVIR